MAPTPASSSAPYRVYNIGNSQPVELLRYIEVLEHSLGRMTERRLLPLQPEDAPDTYADVTALQRDTGDSPSTSIEVGIGRFVDWYRRFHGISETPAGDAAAVAGHPPAPRC